MYRYHPSKLIWAGECLILKIRSQAIGRRAGYRGLDATVCTSPEQLGQTTAPCNTPLVRK